MDIGVYGLGRFGSFWAGCLASAGCNVKAYSRSEHPLPPGVERGTEDEVLSAPYLFFAVSISSFEKGCSLLLEIRNSIAGDILWDGSVPHSRRSGGGIGLRNVTSILSCHGGMVRFSTEDGVFITQLVIPL